MEYQKLFLNEMFTCRLHISLCENRCEMQTLFANLRCTNISALPDITEIVLTMKSFDRFTEGLDGFNNILRMFCCSVIHQK